MEGRKMRVAMETKNNTFAVLNLINCNEHKEEKNGLSYLSWAWAWQIAKANFPDATYTIYENAQGWDYHTDGKTCWVKTGVTIGGVEHIEYLPVMDFKNRSILLDDVTSFDVNKTIQRSLTKAIARHGLGLYIYAGEDLPDAADDATRAEVNAKKKGKAAQNQKPVKRTVDQETYWKFVAAEAKGQKTPTGRSSKEAWMSYAQPSQEEIAQFDSFVDQYKTANNIQ